METEGGSRGDRDLASLSITSPIRELDALDSQTLTHLEEWNTRMNSANLVSSSGEWSPGNDSEPEIDDAEPDLGDTDHTGVEDSDVETTIGNSEDEDFTDYENQGMVDYQARIEQGMEDSERQCWVCFASEEDDPVAAWVHPCKCRGTTKWVHQVCLQRWVDEKQKGNSTTSVSCPQCGTGYVIQFPPSGPFLALLEQVDKLVGRLCPVIAGGVCVTSLYWTCVTYGAVTVMQVAGHERGLALIDSADPLLLLVSLPLVPLALVMAKMIRWQEPVLRFLRARLPGIPITRFVLPAFSALPESEGSASAAALPPQSDPVSVTRTFCGALLFPTMATFLGSTLFEDVKSPLKRAAMGGFCFVGVKGVLKIYHKQNQYVRQCKRVILDYNQDN